jgi:hypothetical protein
MTYNGDISREEAVQATDTRVLFIVHRPGSTPPFAQSYGPGIEAVDFEGVTAPLLARLKPQFVVSALFTPGFDILDLAQCLQSCGFQGAYRAINDGALPKPALVLREVRASCPGLDVDIVARDMFSPIT